MRRRACRAAGAPLAPLAPPPPLLLLALLLLLAAPPRPAAAVKQTKAYVPPESERNYTVHYWTGVGRKGFVWPEQELSPFSFLCKRQRRKKERRRPETRALPSLKQKKQKNHKTQDAKTLTKKKQSPSGAWHMPALSAKPSLGVAVSGGGYRATTTGLGLLRALNSRGLLKRARYLSANSGGSWLVGALSYTQVPWATFFGPGPAPQDMAWEAVREGKFVPAGSYGGAIEKGTIVGEALAGVVVDTVLTPDSAAQVKGWSDTVGEAFLDPFGVGAHGSSVTALGAGIAGAGGATTTKTTTKTTKTTAAAANNGTAAAAGRRRLFAAPPPAPLAANDDPLLGVPGPVAERVSAQSPSIPFLSAAGEPDRPFPLLVGSILAPNTTHPYRPVEFTPLYVATPGRDPPPVAGETRVPATDPATGKTVPVPATYPPLGGSAVEPLGLNSYPPENTAALPTNGVPRASPAGAAAAVARSRFVAPLVTLVGVSSSFVAQGLRPSSDAGEDITGTETLWYWGSARGGGADEDGAAAAAAAPVAAAFAGRQWGFADGGGVDNSAIIPLLRRGVRTIVAGTSTVVGESAAFFVSASSSSSSSCLPAFSRPQLSFFFPRVGKEGKEGRAGAHGCASPTEKRGSPRHPLTHTRARPRSNKTNPQHTQQTHKNKRTKTNAQKQTHKNKRTKTNAQKQTRNKRETTKPAVGPATNASAWGAAQWDVAGLFGAVSQKAPAIKKGRVNGMLVSDFNDFMQVRRRRRLFVVVAWFLSLSSFSRG